MKKATKDQIISSCNPLIAKSRFFRGSWINRDTGVVIPLSEALVLAKMQTKTKFNTSILVTCDKALIREALESLDYLSREDLKKINAIKPEFMFFNNCLTSNRPYKIDVLLECYTPMFGVVSKRLFYQNLKHWAAENEVKLKFTNVRSNAKVTPIR